MINKCSVEHVLEVVYFFYDVGDITLVLGFQHDDELTLIGLAMNFCTGKLLYTIFYRLQVIWFDMYNHARNVNFLAIHYATHLAGLKLSPVMPGKILNSL